MYDRECKQRNHTNKNKDCEEKDDDDDDIDDILRTRMEDLCRIVDDLSFESINFAGCGNVSLELYEYCTSNNIPAHIAIELSRLAEFEVPNFCEVHDISPQVGSELTSLLHSMDDESRTFYCGHCKGLAHCQTCSILIGAGHTECLYCLEPYM